MLASQREGAAGAAGAQNARFDQGTLVRCSLISGMGWCSVLLRVVSPASAASRSAHASFRELAQVFQNETERLSSAQRQLNPAVQVAGGRDDGQT